MKISSALKNSTELILTFLGNTYCIVSEIDFFLALELEHLVMTCK